MLRISLSEFHEFTVLSFTQWYESTTNTNSHVWDFIDICQYSRAPEKPKKKNKTKQQTSQAEHTEESQMHTETSKPGTFQKR